MEQHAKMPIALLPNFFPRKNSGLGEFRTMENLDANPEIKKQHADDVRPGHSDEKGERC